MCIATLCRSRYNCNGCTGGRSCRFQLQNRLNPGRTEIPNFRCSADQKSRGRTPRLGKKVDVCTFSGLTPPLTSQPSFPSYANKVYPTTLSYQGVTPNPHVFTLIIE